MPCKSQMFEKFILQIWSASPIQDINTSAPILALTCYFRQYYWLRRRRNSYKNFQRFAYSSRHRLLILLEWAETEIKRFKGKQHVQIENNPWSPQPQADYRRYIVSLPTHPFFPYHLLQWNGSWKGRTTGIVNTVKQ